MPKPSILLILLLKNCYKIFGIFSPSLDAQEIICRKRKEHKIFNVALFMGVYDLLTT